MTNRPALLLAWAAIGFLTSAVVFAVIHAALFLLAPRRTAHSDATLSSITGIAAYAGFNWVFLGLITLPILIAPVLMWPWVLRMLPSVECSRSAFIFTSGLFAMLAIAVRVAILEYPALLRNPTLLIQLTHLVECVSLWLGLLLPRFGVPALRLGAFAPRGVP